MRAYVDPDVCIGCGLCTGIAGSVFEMNDEGRAVAVADTSYELEGVVKEAIDSCPVNAIREEE